MLFALVLEWSGESDESLFTFFVLRNFSQVEIFSARSLAGLLSIGDIGSLENLDQSEDIESNKGDCFLLDFIIIGLTSFIKFFSIFINEFIFIPIETSFLNFRFLLFISFIEGLLKFFPFNNVFKGECIRRDLDLHNIQGNEK